MQLDPVLAADAREWLRKARDDLRGADIDLAASPALIEDALFHCQQAAEKSLKGFLTFHNVPFRRTHSIEEIGQACLVVDPTLTSVVDEATPLSEYAWTYRYPGPTPIPLVGEAVAARAIAGRVYGAVLSRLPAGARP